jgi:hypothetical protein
MTLNRPSGRFGPRGPIPTAEQLAAAIKDALASPGLDPASRIWLLNLAVGEDGVDAAPFDREPYRQEDGASTLPAVGPARPHRAATKARKPPTLVELFEEATALARDETLEEAERGRRLVDLLGDADTFRIRLTHQYGPKLAADIIATREEPVPWSIVAGHGGH